MKTIKENVYYIVTENANGDYSLTYKGTGNIMTGTQDCIMSLAAIHDKEEEEYWNSGKVNDYLDFPPDGYYSNDEARADAELMDLPF